MIDVDRETIERWMDECLRPAYEDALAFAHSDMWQYFSTDANQKYRDECQTIADMILSEMNKRCIRPHRHYVVKMNDGHYGIMSGEEHPSKSEHAFVDEDDVMAEIEVVYESYLLKEADEYLRDIEPSFPDESE